jgi:TatD DNase family protein
LKELPLALIDTHCHLDAPIYSRIEEVYRRSCQAGVHRVVAVGTGLVANQRLLALQQRYPTYVWAALGLHPERLDLSWGEVESVMAQLETHRAEIVAVGEIGLPHYTVLDRRMTDSQAKRNETYLHTLVRAAARLELPVVLHAPHATAAVALKIVQHYEPPGAVFHWHKSDPETTAAICAAGYYLSVTPEVCYRERDRELVRTVPLAHLLLETDGPWPYDGEFAGQETSPGLVTRVAEEVAQLKGVPFTEVCAITTANAHRLFGNPATP